MDSLLIAAKFDRLAFRCLRRGRHADALDYFHRALAVREEVLGEMSFDVANTLTIMAGVFALYEDDQEKAAALWRRSVEIYSFIYKNGSENKRNVAIGLKGTLENLATHSYDRGDYSEAETFFRRAMEVLQDEFGTIGMEMMCNYQLYLNILEIRDKNT